MSMRIPPHVHRDIYAGMVKMEFPKADDAPEGKGAPKAGDWSLVRSREKGQAKTTKRKGRAWRTEKGRGK